MDRRTKILASLFGLAIVYILGVQVVYPRWIEPVFSLKKRIAEKSDTLTDLEQQEKRVSQAVTEYRQYMERAGFGDAAKIEVELRDRLNKLIEKHALNEATVSAARNLKDAKSGMERISLDVTAEATFPAAVSFLKDVTELPQVLRLGNVKFAKGTASRGVRDSDRVNLTVPLELLIPAPQKFVGPLDEAKAKSHDTFVRHQGRDYSAIWDRKPFLEHEPVRPLSITLRPKVLNPKVNAPTQIQATVGGGNGELKYQWSPPEGLSDPTSLTPKVDTSTPGNKVYSLTVTDSRGQSSTDSISVNISEPVVAERPPPPPVELPKQPVKQLDQPWPEGNAMQVAMVWTTYYGDRRAAEMGVTNNRTRSTDYYKVGDGFDGGELVFLHQRGAVVRRNDDYWLYPIGTTLDSAICERDGEAYPELQVAAREHRERLAPPITDPNPADEPKSPSNSPRDFVGPMPGPEALGAAAPKVEAPLVPPMIQQPVQGDAATSVGTQENPGEAGVGTPPPDAINNRAKAKRRGSMGSRTPTQPAGAKSSVTPKDTGKPNPPSP